MLQIDYKKLINELNDESFVELKGYLVEYFPFHFIDESEVTKSILLEKIGDYLLGLQLNKNLKDSQLPKKYCDLLLRYINYRYVGDKNNKTIAFKLFERANVLKNAIDHCSSVEDLHQNLLDFSKIFLVLYNEYMKKKHPVLDPPFSVVDISFEELTDYLSEDKPAMNPVVNQLAEFAENLIAKVIPEKPVEAAVDVADDFIGKISKIRIPLKEKVKNKINEPIYQYAVSIKKDNPYNLKTFAAILLAIMFVTNKEIEVKVEE